MRSRYTKIVFAALVGLATVGVVAHQAPRTHGDHAVGTTRSSPGDNPWNRGQPPEDWWAEIERSHGHVGPWNVLGWRIGQAALREFETEWGRHTLDIVCYIPRETPYSCMADGLTIGTGNSIGRLDIRLAEAMSMDLIQVCIRRKDEQGPILVFEPRVEYVRRIRQRQVEELEGLSRECRRMRDGELFRIRRIESN